MTARLVARLDDIRCHVLHLERLELGERAGHVGEGEHCGTIDAHLEAALARLLLVDLDCGPWEARLDKGLELGGPCLESASALARLNLDDGAGTAGRRGRRLGGSRLLHLLGRCLLHDRLLRRHLCALRRREQSRALVSRKLPRPSGTFTFTFTGPTRPPRRARARRKRGEGTARETTGHISKTKSHAGGKPQSQSRRTFSHLLTPCYRQAR